MVINRRNDCRSLRIRHIKYINSISLQYEQIKNKVLQEFRKNRNNYFKSKKDIINVELKLYKLKESFKYRNKFIQIITLINQKGRVGKTTPKRLKKTTNYFFYIIIKLSKEWDF